MEVQIYRVENLNDARKYLASIDGCVILANPEGSTKYYGMRVVDYMFKILESEFPDKIDGIIIDAYNDYSALVAARQLGYDKIKYNNG